MSYFARPQTEGQEQVNCLVNLLGSVISQIDAHPEVVFSALVSTAAIVLTECAATKEEADRVASELSKNVQMLVDANWHEARNLAKDS